MSLHDLPPPRKRRHIGVWLPFVAAVLLSIGWTGWWLWSRGEARAQLESGASSLRAAGYDVAWQDISLGGYPFRLDIVLAGARIADRSGWALETPRLEAEANMLALGHWILATPQGLSVIRPEGGRIDVTGRLLRASLRSLDDTPPAFSFEGADLAFAPGAGAQPFVLAAAKTVEFHLRKGPDNEGGVFAKLEGGRATPGRLFAIAGEGKPVSFAWNSTFSKSSALKGEDWAAAVRAWSAAGGAVHLRDAGVTAGDVSLTARDATLAAGRDGRLSGSVPVTLRNGPRALLALGQIAAIPPETAEGAALIASARQGLGQTAEATLYFQAGKATLGPIAIAPAPKVY
ncbi:DUF2125 domain-containing protein [Phenylobacterium immobile]|uniref:DUF2125 domain-containing protein n=1 Tax=Phenylobacterium immobile TaxID=21 RepID=UPI000ABB678F|nr:DUF2125 domain-containing protein [Phenylobacterium immobile]